MSSPPFSSTQRPTSLRPCLCLGQIPTLKTRLRLFLWVEGAWNNESREYARSKRAIQTGGARLNRLSRAAPGSRAAAWAAMRGRDRAAGIRTRTDGRTEGRAGAQSSSVVVGSACVPLVVSLWAQRAPDCRGAHWAGAGPRVPAGWALWHQ